jgi:hypothetical protein
LAKSLTNNFSREDKVIQDGVVDSSQGTGSGARLLTIVTTTRDSQDATLGNENNVTVRELLLKFTSKPLKRENKLIDKTILLYIHRLYTYFCWILWKP